MKRKKEFSESHRHDMYAIRARNGEVDTNSGETSRKKIMNFCSRNRQTEIPHKNRTRTTSVVPARPLCNTAARRPRLYAAQRFAGKAHTYTHARTHTRAHIHAYTRARARNRTTVSLALSLADYYATFIQGDFCKL